MRVVSWNIQGNVGVGPERWPLVADALRSTRADLLCLQEVNAAKQLPDRIRSAVGAVGLEHWYFHGSRLSGYGNAIASQYPVRPVVLPDTDEDAHAPIASVIAETPSGPVATHSVHIPNGSTYGWRKIDAFEALARAVGPNLPTIVGGDFNEPMRVLPSGELLSFMCDEDGRVATTWKGQPGARWQTSVAAVLGPRAVLQHAWLSLNPGMAEITHVTRGAPRFFDHILASRHFRVLTAGFTHAWRTSKPRASDHSGAWAELEVVG